MLSLVNRNNVSGALNAVVLGSGSGHDIGTQKFLLGEMLVRKGLLSRNQLQTALARQQGTEQKLGEVIVSMGLLSDKQISQALTRQRSYRYAIALATAVMLPFAPSMAFAGHSSKYHTASSSATSTTNQAPVISGTPATSITAGSAYYFKPTARDPEGKTLYFRIKNKPAWASFNSKTGELKGTPTDGNIGTFSNISFSASDGYKTSYLPSFSLTVSPQKVTLNLVPTTTSASYSTNMGVAFSGVFGASDPEGGALTFSMATMPSHGTLVITNANSGAFTYTPTAGYVGSDTFTFRATDAYGASATANLNMTMNSVNRAPIATNGSASLNENSTSQGTLTASDADGDTLSFSVSSLPSHGAVTLTNATTGAYSYVPAANYNGTDSFSFEVNDGHGGTASAAQSFTIQGVNAAPVIQARSFSTSEDSSVSGNLFATDADGDLLTFALSGSAAHGTLIITNAATGAFTYTPAANYNGTDSFNYTVSDGNGSQAAGQSSISISAVNDAPTASNGSFSLNEDNAFSGAVSASDVDGGALTYSLSSNVAHGTLSLNSTTGSFTFTPAANYFGADSFTFQARDASGATATAQVALNILSVNDQPTAVSDSASTAKNTALTIPVLNNDTGLGDGGILLSLATNPGHGTASLSNNQILYTPTSNYSGSDSISYRVTDANGDSSVATLSINVTCSTNCTSNVTLNWSAPTTRTDNSSLANLSGFMVYYGTAPGNYSHAIDVASTTNLSQTINGLTAGTYYFSVTAYDANGMESAYASEVSRTIN